MQIVKQGRFMKVETVAGTSHKNGNAYKFQNVTIDFQGDILKLAMFNDSPVVAKYDDHVEAVIDIKQDGYKVNVTIVQVYPVKA